MVSGTLPTWDDAAPPAATAVLRFWFGRRRGDFVGTRSLARWRALGALHVPRWVSSPEADRGAARFAELLATAREGACRGWLEGAAGTLALVILCDQLPRSMHRGTARAYAADDLALDASISGAARGHDRGLSLVEQAFFFTPLVHAEDRAHQRRADERYAALREGAPEKVAPLLEVFAASARRHRRIIERFGRFPHRNRVLGRQDTGAERRFLADPWSFFECAAGEASP